ncbi:hypothetical protein BG006_008190 [Podila minutissima]|uniref:N-acetylglucosamine-6-phosphate deacetylase n=1 Tax=Podila minutissima TaxID=64525 RepID=A0A9P5VK54_9FUNG|nr:hypothetical protein BG006_008190 [Podila minutissima]
MMQYPVALQTNHSLTSSPPSPVPLTPLPENEPKVTKIINCKILRDRKIVEHDSIWIQGGKIIDPHKFFWYQKRLPDLVLDAGGLLVAPGFIEAQINGAFGVDFSVPSDHDTYEKDLLKVNRGLLKYGTTSYCPTIVSSSASVYHQVLSHLKPRAGSAETGATILGAHVEGPFINKARIGAHELKVLQASAKNGYKDFKDVYGFEGETPEAQKKLSEEDLHSVKIITCAPELEGIMDSIPDLVRAGITVSVGHSMANISQAEQAVTNGATFITHLFNAMPQFHHRDPGVIGLLGSRLDLPRPYYGLICDGIHVHPNSVKIAYDSHPEGVILVTDAMSAMGLAPGNYQLGNMRVTKDEDRVYIEGTDTLAGRAEEGGVKTPLDGDPGRLTIETKSSSGSSAQDTTSGIDPTFLPTHPRSTPLSPLSLSKSTIETQQLPHSYFYYNPDPEGELSTSVGGVVDEWIIEMHEYDVYEEYEGSEHSVRIMSVHYSDDDDDAPYFHSRTGSDASDDSRGFFSYSTGSEAGRGTGVGPSQVSLVAGLEGANSSVSHPHNLHGVDLTMTDCGCNHPATITATQETTQATKKKASTNDIDDGDLCCPSSSVITLDACIRNFIKFTSCSVIEALEAVTLHPAVLLGIQETKGVIKPGADADLVFLDPELFVRRVFVAGQEVELDGIDVQVTEKF